MRVVYRGDVPTDKEMNALKIRLGSCILAALCSCSDEKAEVKTQGAYDPGGGVLNIVTYSKPGPNPGYVNSMWELQEDPLSGDVINAYNDGAPEPGADPLKPLYELETSSPAADLEPGDTLTHVQATVHLRGAKEEVNRISEKVLGADLDRIMSAF